MVSIKIIKSFILLSMSLKKTIQINPELFKLPSNKTRKREKKELILNPIIAPNNLKNKLLRRIKEHKTLETNKKNNTISANSATDDSFSDEFTGAIDYLSDLTKKKKVQKTLMTKTLKNPSLSSSPPISLELPPELTENFINQIVPQNNDIYNVNYKVNDDVPYGCMKGGNKKTYREWKEIQKPSTPSHIDIPDIIRPPTPPKRNDTSSKTEEISRELKLEQIKNKLKLMQSEDVQQKQKKLEDFKKLEKNYLSNGELNDLGNIDDEIKISHDNINNLIKEREQENKIKEDQNKQYLKKTIKKKFVLGKSNKLRQVSVLIKDKNTRKNILNTQKELKKTNINDVKKYLRQHGMIKVGSTCPVDILRKTFESAVLTGEVINTNKDVLLHNFIAGSEK